MFTILIAFAVSLVIFLVRRRSYFRNKPERWGAYYDRYEPSIAGMFGIGCVFAFVSLFAASIIFGNVEPRWVKYELPLVALNDSTQVEGRSSFLGGGYINESWVYVFYYPNDTGGYELGWDYEYESVIYEEDRTDAVRYTFVDESPVLGKWTFGYNGTTYKEFHVPEGSIARDITFDLNK